MLLRTYLLFRLKPSMRFMCSAEPRREPSAPKMLPRIDIAPGIRTINPGRSSRVSSSFPRKRPANTSVIMLRSMAPKLCLRLDCPRIYEMKFFTAEWTESITVLSPSKSHSWPE